MNERLPMNAWELGARIISDRKAETLSSGKRSTVEGAGLKRARQYPAKAGRVAIARHIRGENSIALASSVRSSVMFDPGHGRGHVAKQVNEGQKCAWTGQKPGRAWCRAKEINQASLYAPGPRRTCSEIEMPWLKRPPARIL